MKQLVDRDLNNVARIINSPDPVNPGDLTPKSWVEALVNAAVAGLLDPKGVIDCSTNPNYPSALKGDTYVVSVGGKIGGVAGKTVNAYDVVIAFADNAGGTEVSVGTSWNVVETNRDQATDLILGLGKIANQTQANNGTEDKAWITPLTLQTKLDAYKVVLTIGDGVATSFQIPHSWNTRDLPKPSIRRNSAPYDYVEADSAATTTTYVTVSGFIVPPATDEFVVILTKQ